MASLIEENRLRLQQRISQRLRGGATVLPSRTELPHRFIAQRRRHANGPAVDPFRLQAQDYIFNNKTLADKYDISQIIRQAHRDHSDMMQLPMLRPRYTELHPNKGVPTQKYIDLILNRKGPMRRAPSRKLKGGMFSTKEYDDSISIKSYRYIDNFEAQNLRPSRDEDERLGGKIVAVAPQRIQYEAHQNQRQYEAARNHSPPARRKDAVGISTLKGKSMSTGNNGEMSMSVPPRASRNLPFLHKLRKRLGSRDRKFVDKISSQTFLTENEDNKSLAIFSTKGDSNPTSRIAPLPPIRITVTNPMPEDIPAYASAHDIARIKEADEREHQAQPDLEDKQKRMPLVKFSLPKKKRPMKKLKRRKRRSTPAPPSDQIDNSENTMMQESNNGDQYDDYEGDNNHRRLSHTDSLMPAPITKITFQSFNESNLRKPKKVVTNVHVERVIQRNVVATHPDFVDRKDPAVKVSTFEMAEDSRPEMVCRKDGTLGPAPASTNYVNFQKTMRQSGQSRVLLSLRHRTLAAEAANDAYEWSQPGLVGLRTSDGGLLGDISYPPKPYDGTASHRKLGRIRAMKRSLLKAHKALFEENEGNLEVDALTEETRSERSYASDLTASVTSIGKSYYINRINDASNSQNQADKGSGFYMRRSDDTTPGVQHISSKRTIGTQWTTDKITAPLNTPEPPPNTAFLNKTYRQ